MTFKMCFKKLKFTGPTAFVLTFFEVCVWVGGLRRARESTLVRMLKGVCGCKNLRKADRKTEV